MDTRRGLSGAPAPSPPEPFLDPLLVVATAVVALALALYVAWVPPLLAEVFEYAEVARNLLQHGELRQDHIRDWMPGSRDLPLPHPAGQRANLYPFLLVPFVALLGHTHWVVTLPAIVGHVLLVFVTYRLGLRLAPAHVARLAALLLLVHPRLIHLVVSDPQPAALAWAASLASLGAFLDRRYVTAGFLVALSVGLSIPAAVVAFTWPLWILLCERRELRRPALWAGAAVALLVLAPLGIRNHLVFGSAVFAESWADTASVTADMSREWNRLEILFRYERPAPPEATSELRSELEGWAANTANQWFGEDSIDYYPGLLELLFLPLLPFILAGAWRTRHSRPTRFLTFVSVAFLALFSVLTRGYEDRYFFHLAAIGLVFGAIGLDALRQRWASGRLNRLLHPGGLLTFLLVTEVGAVLIPTVMTALRSREAEGLMAREVAEAAAWIRSEAREDARIVAFPPGAIAFHTGGLVVPWPYDGTGSLARVAADHDVELALYVRLFGPQAFPRPPFLEPIATGRFVTLARLEPEAAARYARAAGPEADEDGLLAAFADMRGITSRVRRPLWAYLGAATGSALVGTALWAGLLVAHQGAWSRSRRRGRSATVLAGAAICLVAWILSAASHPAAARGEVFRPVDEVALAALLERVSGAPVLLVPPPGMDPRAELAHWRPSEGAAEAEGGSLDDIEARPKAVLLVLLPDPTAPIDEPGAFRESGAQLAAIEAQAETVRSRAQAAGRRTHRIGGALILEPRPSGEAERGAGGSAHAIPVPQPQAPGSLS
jgi:4-amino-4-deoxy-L-arabinose transferase-like glycosyltransferase